MNKRLGVYTYILVLIYLLAIVLVIAIFIFPAYILVFVVPMLAGQFSSSGGYPVRTGNSLQGHRPLQRSEGKVTLGDSIRRRVQHAKEVFDYSRCCAGWWYT